MIFRSNFLHQFLRVRFLMRMGIVALLIILGGLWGKQQVLASPDLTVTCQDSGDCSINPDNTPLFDEGSWYPGASQAKVVRIHNDTSEGSLVAIELQNYSDSNDLGGVIDLQIHRGDSDGPLVYGPISLQDLNTNGYADFDDLSAGETQDYFMLVAMRTTAGNAYQNSFIRFDLNIGHELVDDEGDVGDDVGTDSPDNGTVAGTTTTTTTTAASPPECTATPPSSAPALSLVGTTPNTVSLSWTAVSPVTHYALVFERVSDGAMYGSTDIGNVTEYVVSNLSGGENYIFRIQGVNDCAPGPWSNDVASGLVAGPVITTPPTGPTGEVLGVDDPDEDREDDRDPSELEAGLVAGQVEGVFDDQCTATVWWLLILILVAQLLGLLLLEWWWREQPGKTKLMVGLIITASAVALLWLWRDCDCYAVGSWLVWLCEWFWLVAVGIAGLTRLVGYGLFEDFPRR